MWLMPSLNRPQSLERFCAACVLAGTSTPGMILIDRADYAEHQTRYGHLKLPLGWRIHLTEGVTQGDKVREVWETVRDCAWLGLIGDDNVPETHGWDAKLVAALDGWDFVSCDDGWQAPKRAGNCWAISGPLVRQVGYIFAPGMHHLFVDDLWEALGRDAGCWTQLMDVRVRHVHVMKGAAFADDTHRAAYGKGFTPDHPGPDLGNGLWTSDETAYRRWSEQEKPGLIAAIRQKRQLSKPALRARVADDPAAEAARAKRALSRSVFIGTPVARAPCWEYTLAFAETCVALDKLGIRYTTHFIVGNSNLPRARNELCARFLVSGMTDLVFIDDDMSWKAKHLIRLLASDKPVIAGVGRKKIEAPMDKADIWCCKFPDDAIDGLVQDEMGNVMVDRVGTGFMKIERSVLERLAEAHPEWKGAGPQEMPAAVRDHYFRFFRFGDEGEMGEDYVFSERWKALGGEIWIDPTIELGHSGSKLYEGRIADIMQAAS